MQYGQANIQGPCWLGFPVALSSVLTARGAVHIGQLKQFLAHLQESGHQNQHCFVAKQNRNNRLHLPIAFTPNHTTRRLKQTIRAIPTHNLLRYAPRTFDLMTILTVQKLLGRVERKVGAWRSRIKSPAIILFVILRTITKAGLRDVSRSPFP